MVVFHSSIFYFDFKAFIYASWANIKRFKFWLLISVLLTVIIFVLLNFTILIFRLLDEILFYGYRKTKIEKPVFIISNPRSGTTMLHRLMTIDEDRFAHFLLYHTLGNSILFNKLVDLLGKIDQRIGHPLRKFFNWSEKIFFSGWKDIHPTGWSQSEEDEALFTFSFSSPAVAMIFPYLKFYDWINFPDKWSPKKGRKLMGFYKNSVQRFMYSEGKGRRFLSKNVLSTGRIKLILEMFPDAQIIYPVRHPYQAIPSFVSMFAQPWKALYSFIPENSDEYRQWSNLAITYYQYFEQISKELPESQFYSVSYQELIADAENVVCNIYSHFEMKMSQKVKVKIREKTNRNRKYKSKHNYSFEEYGLTKKEIYDQLKPVFDKFNFEP